MPPVPAAGVPLIVAEPLALALNVTPEGRLPDSVTDAAGNPVVVTLNVRAEPTLVVADAAEVMAEASSTVSVKAWLAEPPLLVALRVRG